MKPMGYSKMVGEYQKVSFEKPNKTMSFFSKCFSKHSVKTH